MTARLLLLLAMFFGIAFAPVKPLVRCAVAAAPACERCCPSAGHACCAAMNTPAQPAPMAPAGNAADDGKQLAAPALIFLCLRPTPATESPAVQRLHAARLPALPLLELICVRLI